MRSCVASDGWTRGRAAIRAGAGAGTGTGTGPETGAAACRAGSPEPRTGAAGAAQFFSMFQKNGTGETSTPESSLRHATGWNHCP